MGRRAREVTLKSVRFEKRSGVREISPRRVRAPSTGTPFRPIVSQVTEASQPSRSSRRRVAAVVGLTVLEVIRSQDLPKEILEAEDPSITMPRRLGLSDVIDRRIRMYREEVKRGGRMTDEEVGDLIRLVIRRPDSTEVFFRVGRILAGDDGNGMGWRGLLPAPVAFALARRAVSRRIRKLLGRRLASFTDTPFTLETRDHVLLAADPGGDACHLVTGLAEALVQRYTGSGCKVAHDHCRAHRDDVCRWTVVQEETVKDADTVSDLLLNPEPGAG